LVTDCDFTLRDTADVLILDIDPRRRFRIPRINIILFVLTLISVYFMPVFLKHFAVSEMSQAISNTMADLASGTGIVFTMAMISILFVHEMGHFIASRRRGIITSWPYFIPAPNIIGTFGAVIKSKSPFWNRRDLIEVGASGPIAGWIVALGWLVYGLSHSHIVPMEAVGPTDFIFFIEGESILMRSLLPALVGQTPEGTFYLLNEAAFAGWVGLLVTAINLLPIGQLDGGHIIYGLARHLQRKLGLLAMGGLFILGFDSPMWWIFAAFGLVFGVKHPPTMNDSLKLSRTAAVLGVVSIIILVLSFTPIPFQ
jgi:membrane-associated protease RseP (regulator of RpoE activity)